MSRLVKDFTGIDHRSETAGLRENTRLVRGYSGVEERTGAVSTPIYQSATFVHPGFDRTTGFGYSRCGNPTRLELENTLAMLEHGKKAWAFSSGMSAISIAVKLFQPGDQILVSDDLYGGTYRLFNDYYYGKYGIKFDYIDTSSLPEIKNALKPETKAIFVETPSNPTMKVTDLQAVSDLIHGQNGLLIVDNTFLSPYFQKPVDFGADIVVHSGTKYLGGHNDVLCGFLVVKDESLIEPVFKASMAEGGTLDPFDSWLVLRSIKTLGIRLEKQQANAFEIYKFLKTSDKVEKIYYVGDPDHEGYEISRRQTTGFGGMISFSVKDAETVPDLLNHLRLILFAESLGGVESLITFPLMQTHGEIPEALRNKLGINDRLLRLSVGIEDAQDLIEDLEQALR
ncbi:PLP-dependent transferase [Caproiciproducens sp. NJN-50]|nr:PLP-dependent aspartate aminotransferase family protein [Caproicibacter sp. BJN0012]QAT51325.1 PLP-dependent transferase [Caproiciproducens sp. NJN-50]